MNMNNSASSRNETSPRRRMLWLSAGLLAGMLLSACASGAPDVGIDRDLATDAAQSVTTTSVTQTADVSALADSAAGSALVEEIVTDGFTEEEAACLVAHTFEGYDDVAIADMVRTGDLPDEIDARVFQSMEACVTAERQDEIAVLPVAEIEDAYREQGFTDEEVTCIFSGLEEAHGGRKGLAAIISGSLEDEEFYLGLETITLACLTDERQAELAQVLGG